MILNHNYNLKLKEELLRLVEKHLRMFKEYFHHYF